MLMNPSDWVIVSYSKVGLELKLLLHLAVDPVGIAGGKLCPGEKAAHDGIFHFRYPQSSPPANQRDISQSGDRSGFIFAIRVSGVLLDAPHISADDRTIEDDAVSLGK